MSELGTYLIMVIIGIVFFFFIGEKGTILEKDSMTYLEYTELGLRGAAPAYPLFLDIFRQLWGPELFADRVYLVQGIFALIVSVVFARYLSVRFELSLVYSILAFICSLLPYTYTLKEYVATHAVMTESIAFPLFYLFFIGICEIQGGITLKNGVFAVLAALLLVLTRKQLIICFVVVIYLILYNAIYRDDKEGKTENKKSVVLFSLAFWVLFFGAIISYGLKAESQIGNALLGKSLTIMRRDDEMYFISEDDKEIFRSLYSAIESEGTRIEDARSYFLKWDDIVKFNEANLRLAYKEIPLVVITQEHEGTGTERMYDFMSKINRIALRHHKMDLFVEFLYLIPSGLLSMIFIQKRNAYLYCLLYGLGFYIIYFLLLLWAKKSQKADNSILSFSSLSLLISLANLVFTNTVLYGIQRYLVYTMGILYISILIMLKTFINGIK